MDKKKGLGMWIDQIDKYLHFQVYGNVFVEKLFVLRDILGQAKRVSLKYHKKEKMVL